MAEGEQRFEPLEGQFDLPSATVHFKDGRSRDVRTKSGEHEDVLGRLQRLGLDLVATPTRLALCPGAAALCRRLALFDGAHAPGDGWQTLLVLAHGDRPIADPTRIQGAQMRQPGKRLS